MDQIRIYCMDKESKVKKEKNHWDELNVVISGKEFGQFLQTAY